MSPAPAPMASALCVLTSAIAVRFRCHCRPYPPPPPSSLIYISHPFYSLSSTKNQTPLTFPGCRPAWCCWSRRWQCRKNRGLQSNGGEATVTATACRPSRIKRAGSMIFRICLHLEVGLSWPSTSSPPPWHVRHRRRWSPNPEKFKLFTI